MTSNTIRLTFLGTGTSQGVPVITCKCDVCTSDDARDNRLRTSVLLETQGKTIVIDTGPDFRMQMLRAGTQQLDAVLFTHEHKDHIAGMDDIRPFNFQQAEPMCVFASKQVQEALMREYHYVFSEKKYPGAPQVDLYDISNQPFDVKGVNVIPIEVMHGGMAVLGFRFGDVTYITDAKEISEKEKEKIKGSEILVLNALRHKEHHSHFNLEQALELIKELKPKRAFLTHISHLLGKHEEVDPKLPPGVELAYDGLSVEV